MTYKVLVPNVLEWRFDSWLRMRRLRTMEDDVFLEHNQYNPGMGYVLRKSFRDWMKDNNIKYDLILEEANIFITFENLEDAILFKLIWG